MAQLFRRTTASLSRNILFIVAPSGAVYLEKIDEIKSHDGLPACHLTQLVSMTCFRSVSI